MNRTASMCCCPETQRLREEAEIRSREALEQKMVEREEKKARIAIWRDELEEFNRGHLDSVLQGIIEYDPDIVQRKHVITVSRSVRGKNITATVIVNQK